MSSGGICAFTVAWQRTDQFRRVLSYLGSFTDIRGGHRYPELVRESEKKPVRVFLQAATRDINWDAANLNWFSANLRMATALAERGYDLRLVLGDGSAGSGGKNEPTLTRSSACDGSQRRTANATTVSASKQPVPAKQSEGEGHVENRAF